MPQWSPRSRRRAHRVPSEGDAVLLVHANAVLALPVSSQGLETVAGHRGQVLKPLGAVEHRQLPMHDRPDVTCTRRAALLLRSAHRSAVVASANDWIIG